MAARGGGVLDFTSALYLGLQHPSSSLPPWQALTLGKPAVLESPPGMQAVERELAALTGCDDAVLSSSTLHAFVDLFAMLAERDTTIVLDRNSYPIAQWVARQAAVPGRRVTVLGGEGRSEVKRAVSRAQTARTVIVTDGLSPATGIVSPLGFYANLAAESGGLLVVDDTQAFGVLGESASRSAPYGIGGGGSLRHAGIRSDRVVVVNSLAKAFGVPMAMVGGNHRLIETLRRTALTRVHCSPPSMAVIGAAAHALQLNRHHGDTLRDRLARRVAQLRSGLRELGLAASRSLFPVQPIRLTRGMAATVHSRLLQRRVRAVLSGRPLFRAQVSLLVTTRHTPDDIDAAIACLAWATGAETGHTTGVSGYEYRS